MPSFLRIFSGMGGRKEWHNVFSPSPTPPDQS